MLNSVPKELKLILAKLISINTCKVFVEVVQRLLVRELESINSYAQTVFKPQGIVSDEVLVFDLFD